MHAWLSYGFNNLGYQFSLIACIAWIGLNQKKNQPIGITSALQILDRHTSSHWVHQTNTNTIDLHTWHTATSHLIEIPRSYICRDAKKKKTTKNKREHHLASMLRWHRVFVPSILARAIGDLYLSRSPCGSSPWPCSVLPEQFLDSMAVAWSQPVDSAPAIACMSQGAPPDLCPHTQWHSEQLVQRYFAQSAAAVRFPLG